MPMTLGTAFESIAETIVAENNPHTDGGQTKK